MLIAKDLEDLARGLRKFEDMADSTEMAQKTQKNRQFYKGRASAFRELAEMIEGGYLVLQKEVVIVRQEVLHDPIPKQIDEESTGSGSGFAYGS